MYQPGHLSYHQVLGAIGHYLDRHSYDSLLLCELSDGFVARAVRGDRLPEALPFPLSELHNLVHEAAEEQGTAKAPELTTSVAAGSVIQRIVGSYRDFLGALGQQCDQVGATTILVLELSDSVLGPDDQKAGTTYEFWDSCSQEYLYNEQGVRKLVTGERLRAQALTARGVAPAFARGSSRWAGSVVP